jgi:hypothetical protein
MKKDREPEEKLETKPVGESQESEEIGREQDDVTPSATDKISIDDLTREIRDRDTAGVVNSLLQSLQTSAVYIDARSGGVFFGSEARITGDVVGRGQTKTVAAVSASFTNLPVARVLGQNLEKCQEVYVAPTDYRRAQHILESSHVLVLWGRAHWGKWTSAVHLLCRTHKDAVLEIKPDIELSTLLSLDLQPQCGYVIDTFTADEAKSLNAFTLKRLSEHFKRHESHLIFTVDNRVSLKNEMLQNNLVTWKELPTAEGVLLKHLKWYGKGQISRDDIQDLLQQQPVHDLLSTSLLPGQLDRLAELLSKALKSEISFEDAYARFDSYAERQVNQWFKEHEELDERTFLISLAVFNGSPEESILEADKSLQVLVRPSKRDDEPSSLVSPFALTASQRVMHDFTHVEQGYEITEFGESPTDFVVLDNPSLQPAVLQYVWQTYPALRRPLMEWLHSLGTHPSFGMRVRAAAAVGKLSKYNFGHVRREVILPWANHQSASARVAAALALGVPAWEGDLAPQVLGLLHHWSTLQNNWRLNWTAIAAYGGLVGVRFPDAALSDFENIIGMQDLRLLGVLSRSVVNLFEFGKVTPEYYIKVLSALKSWTSNLNKDQKILIGLLLFLELAHTAQVKTEPEGGVWPTLLWLLQEDTLYVEQVETLWRRALNTKDTRKVARDILRSWVQAADDDSRLVSPLKAFILGLQKGSERESGRLHFYLRQWSTNPQSPSESARRLLNSIPWHS